jgi:hypothetical protein
MMQSADLGNLDHRAKCWRFDGTTTRRILVKRQVRPATRVILEIVSEDSAHAKRVEHNDVVQALPPDGADEPLNVSVLPGTLWGSEHFVNSHRLGGLQELVPITAIAVAQQIAGCFVRRESLNELLRSPLGRSDAQLRQSGSGVGDDDRE